MSKKTTPSAPPSSLNLPKESKRSTQGKAARKKLSDADTPESTKVLSIEEEAELMQEVGENEDAVTEDTRRGERSLDANRVEEDEDQVCVCVCVSVSE